MNKLILHHTIYCMQQNSNRTIIDICVPYGRKLGSKNFDESHNWNFGRSLQLHS